MGNDKTGYIGDSSFGKIFKGKPNEGLRDISFTNNAGDIVGREQRANEANQLLFGPSAPQFNPQEFSGLDTALQGDVASQEKNQAKARLDATNRTLIDQENARQIGVQGQQASARQAKSNADAATAKSITDADLAASMQSATDKAARAKRGKSKLYESRQNPDFGGF